MSNAYTIPADRVAEIRRLVERVYPDWLGLYDMRFRADQVDDLYAAARLAQEQLGADGLGGLIALGATGELAGRLRAVARGPGLLQEGRDLQWLEAPGADPALLAPALRDLWHGDGLAAARLDAAFAFFKAQGLPANWRFPTYYLFLLHPTAEFYIDPALLHWLVDLVRGPNQFSAALCGENYAAMRGLALGLRDAFAGDGAVSLIDVLGIISTAYRAAERPGARVRTLAEPFASLCADFTAADRALTLLHDAAQRLGHSEAENGRLALIYAAEAAELRLYYGPHCVLAAGAESLALAVDEGTLPLWSRAGEPAPGGSDTVAMLRLAQGVGQPLPNEVQRAFNDTLDRLAQTPPAGPPPAGHGPDLLAALDTAQGREGLLAAGLGQGSRAPAPPAPVPPPPPAPSRPSLAAPWLSAAQSDDLLALLETGGQLILSGPPGCGKSAVARRLAAFLTGVDEASEQRQLLACHPGLTYADLMGGPGAGGAVDRPQGLLRRLCAQAAADEGERPFVLILEEIQRIDLAALLGEALPLLGQRGQPQRLAGGGLFVVPPNLRLIGTWNTAVTPGGLDLGLLRHFPVMRLAADPAVLARWLATQETAVPGLERLYRALVLQSGLAPDFRPGPGWFMRPGLDKAGLRLLWRYQVEPYLAACEPAGQLAAEWAWDGDRVRALRGG